SRRRRDSRGTPRGPARAAFHPSAARAPSTQSRSMWRSARRPCSANRGASRRPASPARFDSPTRRRPSVPATARAPSESRSPRTNRSRRAPQRRARSTTCTTGGGGAPCGSRARPTRTARACRPLRRALRRRVRHDAAVAQPNDALGARGERQVVRDEYDRRLRLAVERLEQLDNVRSGLAVEVASRLVGKENARRVGEGARDRDALLLAAGKLGGKVIEPVAQADTAKQLARALAGAGFSAQLERHLHVLERRERGDELKALEDEPDFLPAEARPLILVHRRQVRVVEQHGAAAWRVESGEQAEERRLAAAGWT